MKTIEDLNNEAPAIAAEISSVIRRYPYMQELEHVVVPELAVLPETSTFRGMSPVFRMDEDLMAEASLHSLRRQLPTLIEVDARHRILQLALACQGSLLPVHTSMPIARWVGSVAAGAWRIPGARFDHYSLRFDELDTAGHPKLFEPEVTHATAHGYAARINPLWTKAAYEVQFAFVGEPVMRRVCKKRPCYIELLARRIDEQCKPGDPGDLARYFYQVTSQFDVTGAGSVMAFAARRPVR